MKFYPIINKSENYQYDIDGVIVVDDHQYPRIKKSKHAFAFKMVLSDQIVESKVVDVIWSPSKTGYLKPRIQIQPLKLVEQLLHMQLRIMQILL